MRSLYLYIALLMAISSYAQELQNNTWYFGTNAGLQFFPNMNNPTSISTGLQGIEAAASVSNQRGDLLFYTNSVEVFNHNHVLMTNGSALMGHLSSSQGAMIIPKPGNENNYYIVTIDGITGLKKGLYYSEVDMSDGIGQVLTNNKNTVLRDYNDVPIGIGYNISGNNSEKLTCAPHCNKRDYWLITQIGNFVYSYLVTSAGISLTPETFTTAPLSMLTFPGIGAGHMKMSSNSERIAICYSSIENGQGGLALGDFNNATGEFNFDENMIIISPFIENYYWGAEFSPSSEFIYFGVSQNLYKGDAYGATSANVSLLTGTGDISEIEFRGPLQRAVNGKIYVNNDNGNSPFSNISVINDPDNGLNPDLEENSVTITFGRTQNALPGWVPWQLTTECFPNLTLTAPDIHSQPHIYSYTNYIITTQTYAVNSPQNITLHAGNYIELLPNTSIASGSVFLAEIQECTGCTQEQTAQKSKSSQAVYPANMENTDKILLYPNPAKNRATVSTENGYLKHITITAINGSTVLSKTIDGQLKEYSLDVNNYQKGIYLITVEMKNGKTFNEKLIVE